MASRRPDASGSLTVPPKKSTETRRSVDHHPRPSSSKDRAKKVRPLSGPSTHHLTVSANDILRKGYMQYKDKKRFFVLKNGDLIWWNEMPDKYELSQAAVHNKTAGRISLASTLMIVRDGNLVNMLTESGDAYSTKCSTSEDAEGWVKALTAESDANPDRSKHDKKYGWVTYGEKKRILYLGAGKLDILDAHINLRRVIPLEARSVKADGDLGFDVSSPWSVYSFECANAKERDSWVRKISLQIMRANTRFDDNSWERKGYLAMNKRKSCFFGLKGGKLYYFRSAQQGTGKRFVLADCKIRMVDTREDTFIEITFKSDTHTLRSHSKQELEEWFAALQGAQKGTAVISTTGAYFGAPLAKLFATPLYMRNGLPTVLFDCVLYLDQPSSFATEGLFHQIVDLQVIAPLIHAYNNGMPIVNLSSHSFGAVACLLKHFLKNLPEPLIPENIQAEVLEHRNDSIALRGVMSRVPSEARAMLKCVFELLNNLAFESRLDSNSAVELATVITPLVLWHAKKEDVDADEEDLFMLKGVMAVGTLISRYDDVFEEVQPEVLALKKEVGSDAFDQLLLQLTGGPPAVLGASSAPKKPLPSLEDWAKELRSAPQRPGLPEAFLQAAADKDHEEGLDALAELEKELQTEKSERTTAPPPAAADSARGGVSESTAALRAARPKKKTKKGVHMKVNDAEDEKRRVQNATLMRTLRTSRKSRLTPEELAALKNKLETEFAKEIASRPASAEKLIDKEPRKTLPRTETNALATLDDLMDELQKEKVNQPVSILKRIATSSRLLQARKSSSLLKPLDMGQFLKDEAKISDEAVQKYVPLLEKNNINRQRMHMLTVEYLTEIGVSDAADRTAIADAVQRYLKPATSEAAPAVAAP